jgi:hypothetical protein
MDNAVSRSRVLPAIAYSHALTAARDLARAVELEDVASAVYALTVWAAWIEASRKELPECHS